MTKGDGNGGAEQKSARRLKKRRESILLTVDRNDRKIEKQSHFRGAEEIVKRKRKIDR